MLSILLPGLQPGVEEATQHRLADSAAFSLVEQLTVPALLANHLARSADTQDSPQLCFGRHDGRLLQAMAGLLKLGKLHIGTLIAAALKHYSKPLTLDFQDHTWECTQRPPGWGRTVLQSTEETSSSRSRSHLMVRNTAQVPDPRSAQHPQFCAPFYFPTLHLHSKLNNAKLAGLYSYQSLFTTPFCSFPIAFYIHCTVLCCSNTWTRHPRQRWNVDLCNSIITFHILFLLIQNISSDHNDIL